MIQVIKTLEELEALKNNWENLFTQASTATPYQAWHFVVTPLTCSAGDNEIWGRSC